MYILDDSGKILFEGTRRDCKHYIRKNNLRNFKLTENYVEKVIVVDEADEYEGDEDNDNHLAKAATKEGYFNRVF